MNTAVEIFIIKNHQSSVIASPLNRKFEETYKGYNYQNRDEGQFRPSSTSSYQNYAKQAPSLQQEDVPTSMTQALYNNFMHDSHKHSIISHATPTSSHNDQIQKKKKKTSNISTKQSIAIYDNYNRDVQHQILSSNIQDRTKPNKVSNPLKKHHRSNQAESSQLQPTAYDSYSPYQHQ